MGLKEKLNNPLLTLSRRAFIKGTAGLTASLLAGKYFPSSVEAASFSSQFFPETGFWVYDQEAPFLSGFRNFGGIKTFGYPISRLYHLPQDETGSYQAFQRAILKWEPQEKKLGLIPVMEELHKLGQDGWLESLGIPPVASGDHSSQERLSWLQNEEIKRVYLQNPGNASDWDPTVFYGLPISLPYDCGPFIVQRFENYAFQFWKTGPQKGEVMGILAGEYGKLAGLVPQEALVAETFSDQENTGQSGVSSDKERGQKEAVYRGGVLYHGPYVPEVAITSDDGWWPEQIEKQVEIAQKHGVGMSFFLVGRLLGEPRWQKPIKKLLEAGFELQNHTWSHAWLTKCSTEQIRREIELAQKAIFAWTGNRGSSGRYLRPPFGAHDQRVVSVARELGLEVVMWSSDSGGTRQGKDGGLIDSGQCLANLKTTTGWGSIPLIHTNWNDTGALEPYIEWAKAKEISPVLLTKLVPPQSFV